MFWPFWVTHFCYAIPINATTSFWCSLVCIILRQPLAFPDAFNHFRCASFGSFLGLFVKLTT